jgi:hypothetical protein
MAKGTTMITIMGRARRVCDGITRRQLLGIGAAGLFGLSYPKVLAAGAAPPRGAARAKSVLFVFLYGGPSQLETFDMKPDAPSTIRGPFRPIVARTPGMRICEHLPLLAARSNRFCVLRTLNHPQNDHNGTHYIQTGQPLLPAQRGAANVDATDRDWPSFGSVIQYLDQRTVRRAPAFPGYVFLPKRLGHFAGYDINGQYAGWLGSAYNAVATDIGKRHSGDNPYFRECTDTDLDFRLAGAAPLPGLTLERFGRRESLLEQFNAGRQELDESPAVRHLSSVRARALALLTSTKVGAAFDIRREPDRLRDRYGRNLFGQSLLMGRRMIEAGARFVTVVWDLPVRGDNEGGWDMHAGLERVMKHHLLPGLDKGLSGLLDDLHSRGLLDETLVVVAGEMGRTPRFENRGAQDGRDHWSYCFPCLLAGAGIRGGITFGRSDKDAAWPADQPVSPEDLACTLYHALGIDPHAQSLRDKQDRPVAPVNGGRTLAELFG